MSKKSRFYLSERDPKKYTIIGKYPFLINFPKAFPLGHTFFGKWIRSTLKRLNRAMSISHILLLLTNYQVTIASKRCKELQNKHYFTELCWPPSRKNEKLLPKIPNIQKLENYYLKSLIKFQISKLSNYYLKSLISKKSKIITWNP